MVITTIVKAAVGHFMTNRITRKLKQFFPPYNYDFLPPHLALMNSPPSPFARLTALTLSIGVVITIGWAYWGQLDVQATSTGRLIVSGHSQVIQAYEQSRLTELHVKNGQHVKKGEPLLTLDALGVSQDIIGISYQIEYHTIEKLLYQSLLENKIPHQQLTFHQLTKRQQEKISQNYHHEKAQFDAQIASLTSEIEVNHSSQTAKNNDLNVLFLLKKNIEQRLEARQTLSQKQMISKSEYLEQEKELLETKRLIAQQTSELNILVSQEKNLKERLNAFQSQKHHEWNDKKKQSEIQLSMLEQEYAKFDEREQLEIVRSPVTGTVQQLTIYTLGAVLQPAQNLMVIVPDNDVQIAEVKILNKDIGFIRPGQNVTVKVDAFPYTRYGTIEGEVLSISRDSAQDEQLGLIFPAQISLKQNNLMVDGHSIDITPGMSIVAEIKTDKRRVIDYLLSPIREYLSESMREK